MKFGTKTLFTAVAASLFAIEASATVLTFDNFDHGTVITDQYSGYGVYVNANNGNKKNNDDFAVVYDSTTRPGHNVTNRDTDLNGPNWGRSNIPGKNQIHKGGVLVVQENSRGCGDDVCNRADDRAGGGSITFKFDLELATFGFDILDVERKEADDYKLKFFDSSWNLVDSYVFTDFIARDGAKFGSINGATARSRGDNSLNRISPIALDGKGATIAKFIMGGSGGIDDIKFTTTAVSEPASLAFASLGLCAIFALRRRKTV